jgi:predicted transcriptional regulator
MSDNLKPIQIRLMPETVEALRKLRSRGYLPSAICRKAIEEAVKRKLAARGE